MLLFLQGDGSYEGQRGSSGLQVSVSLWALFNICAHFGPGALLYYHAIMISEDDLTLSVD